MNDEVLTHPPTARRKLQQRAILRIATVVLLAVTGVQVVIWLLIAIIGGHLTEPWWLWTTGAGAALVGAWSLLTGRDGSLPSNRETR
jgi:bacteriorhodopsin